MKVEKHQLKILIIATVIALSAIFSGTFVGHAQDSSLSAHWTFDGNLNDSSGNSNAITVDGGAIYTSGQSGSALSINENRYASLPDSQLVGQFPAKNIEGSGDFTITAWIKLNQLGNKSPIVAKQGNETEGFVFQIDSDNKLNIEIFNDLAEKSFLISANSIPVNIWVHVAVTFDYVSTINYGSQSILKLYIDGADEGIKRNIRGQVVGNTEALEIGKYFWDANDNSFFDGEIDEVYIYNRRHSQTGVNNVMNALVILPTLPPEAVCGNNIIEGDEMCDGTDLNEQSCSLVDEMYEGGELSCDASCLFNTSECTSSTVSTALTELTESTTTPVTVPETSSTINIERFMTLGTVGEDVRALQIFLNENGYVVSTVGAGSLGNETTYFGTRTQGAIRSFQCARDIVCSGNTVTTGYGLVGPLTRAALKGD